MLFIFPKYVRLIWAVPFGLLFLLWYCFVWLFSAKARAAYISNKVKWDNIRTMDDLYRYFKDSYTYKADGLFGILDHWNFGLEFFMKGGDCDDCAFRVANKLNFVLGYNATIYWIYGNGAFNWHFDCYIEKMGFFNYGDIISANTCDINEDYAMKYGWKNPCKWVAL